nr:hypothetical transcript [Hymenolepis microstoma]CUU98202.1 hypothetical transcript [Hymenolepis microstoma]
MKKFSNSYGNLVPFLITSPSRDDLDKLAGGADIIYNHHDRPTINAVKAPIAADTVTHRLDDLTEQFQELKAFLSSTPPRPKRRRLISPRRRRSPSKHDDTTYYYHRIIEDKARRCLPGCEYARSTSRSPSGKVHAMQ